MLKDYPTIKSGVGNFDLEAAERGAALKVASRHLKSFAKWYETGKWCSIDVLAAASLYVRCHPELPARCAVELNLAQLYEQQALSRINPFIPHTSPERRRWFIPAWRPRSRMLIA